MAMAKKSIFVLAACLLLAQQNRPTAQFNTLGQQVNPQFLQPTSARPPRIINIAARVWF